MVFFHFCYFSSVKFGLNIGDLRGICHNLHLRQCKSNLVCCIVFWKHYWPLLYLFVYKRIHLVYAHQIIEPNDLNSITFWHRYKFSTHPFVLLSTCFSSLFLTFDHYHLNLSSFHLHSLKRYTFTKEYSSYLFIFILYFTMFNAI